jgi:hypothetical protein
MTDNLSDYSENKILGQLTGRGWTPPAATFIGLYNVIPTDVGGGTFIVAAGLRTITWALPLNGVVANAGSIVWPSAATAWGTIAAWGIFDGDTGSANLLFYGSFDDDPLVEIGIGDTLSVSPGAISLSLS